MQNRLIYRTKKKEIFNILKFRTLLHQHMQNHFNSPTVHTNISETSLWTSRKSRLRVKWYRNPRSQINLSRQDLHRKGKINYTQQKVENNLIIKTNNEEHTSLMSSNPNTKRNNELKSQVIWRIFSLFPPVNSMNQPRFEASQK